VTSNTLGTAAIAVDQALTASEMDRARLFLEQTQSGVVGAIRSLSESQWTFKPSPGRWSIAEIVEHIVFVQERVLGPIREQLATAQAVPTHDYQRVDEIVIYQFSNRLTKFPAPEFAHPTGGSARSEALERVSTNYVRLKDYLESTPDPRQHGMESPPLQLISKGAYQYMDGYQWILSAAAHTERHTKQILEVIADASFPLQ
jgi:DinB superfamily